MISNDLNNNKWHHVKVLRTGRVTEVILDEEKNTILSPSSYNALSFSETFYIGGYNHYELRDLKNILSTTSRYVGCLKVVEIDNRDPVLYFKKGNTRVVSVPKGPIRFGCSISEAKPSEFAKPSSYITITLEHQNITRKDLTFSVSFRTFNPNGVLASTENQKCSIKLGILHGKVFLETWQGDENVLQSRVEHPTIINDGLWHYLKIIVTKTDIFLLVDSGPRLTGTLPHISYTCIDTLQFFLGGANSNNLKGFVGCINTVKINEKDYDLTKNNMNFIKKKGVREGCKLIDKCYPNPCRNNGRCSQNWKGYNCDCSGTNFYGKHCEISIYRPSCAAYQEIGLEESSYCLLDSDGPGDLLPYTTLCMFDENKVAYTTVHHSKETQFDAAKDGEGKFQQYTFHQLKYTMDMNNIESLIEVSKFCRQKVSFKCYNALFLNAPLGPSNVGWRSRTSELKNYWGGVPKNGTGCACGLNGTCTNKEKLCNCDFRNNKWAEDTGYISDKTNLPNNPFRCYRYKRRYCIF